MSPTICERYRARFSSLGVDPSRVDLLGLLPTSAAHLQAYSLMDVALDTFPYSGTTTTCEALYMGVPVVTMRGASHAHNVTGSILAQLGDRYVRELVCATPDEYVARAVGLGGDLARIAELHRDLRPALLASYLCDAAAFTADYERTLKSELQKGRLNQK